ncbi:cytochrome c oxidase assembly factor 6 homolog isoform X3 [Amblyomma americanum]|uniref:Putative cytochrome c oxidase subunit vib/cox12 n=1 Tax=Amblyomma americanum TaxID=6943 RepID=A0A0C9S006_AMBAM
MSFPNKEQRQKCWDSRDRYWECLDRNADDASRCTETRSFYESRCPSQWVKHFDRKREYLKFKDKIENDGRAAGKPTIVFVDARDARGGFKAVT